MILGERGGKVEKNSLRKRNLEEEKTGILKKQTSAKKDKSELDGRVRTI